MLTYVVTKRHTMNEIQQGSAEEMATHPLAIFFDRVEKLPDVIARRRRSYELLQLNEGMRVADIGCGAGTAAFEMASIVGPSGAVIGIDISEALIDVAKRRAAQRGIQVDLQIGDAGALPFGDASLQGYRAERVYQHLKEPAPFLKEAHRVLAPGGRIVLIDQDWDGVLVDSSDLASTRTIARVTSGGIVNSAAGRQYYRLLKDAGFTNVQVYADTHVSTNYDEYGFFPELWANVADATGVLDTKTIQSWLADQKKRAVDGRFFLAMTHFLGVGYR